MKEYINNKLAGTAAASTLAKRIPFLIELSSKFPQATDFSFLNNTEIVQARLDRSNNVGTQWNNLWHVIGAINTDPTVVSTEAKNYYRELGTVLKAAKTRKDDNNVQTPRQAIAVKKSLAYYQNLLRTKFEELFKEHKLPFKPLGKLGLKRIDNKFIADLQNLVILSLYLYQPALRNDYNALYITNKKTGLDTDNNYLYVRGNTMQLIMNHYKTARLSGQQIINIRPELVEILKIWLPVVDHMTGVAKSTPFLYEIYTNTHKHNTTDEAMRRRIGRVADRILGINLTINDFRVLWEVQIQRDPEYQTLTLGEKKKKHSELLHGIGIAQYYNKV